MDFIRLNNFKFYNDNVRFYLASAINFNELFPKKIVNDYI